MTQGVTPATQLTLYVIFWMDSPPYRAMDLLTCFHSVADATVVIYSFIGILDPRLVRRREGAFSLLELPTVKLPLQWRLHSRGLPRLSSRVLLLHPRQTHHVIVTKGAPPSGFSLLNTAENREVCTSCLFPVPTLII